MSDKPASRMGRPSKRTDLVVDTILDRITEGESLVNICREEGMPHRTTFLDWVNGDEQLSQRYARARTEGCHAIAQDALNIADYKADDYVEDGEGGKVLDREAVMRSKLRVDTRLRLLRAWAPEVYGDRVAMTHDIVGNLADDLKAARERSKGG